LTASKTRLDIDNVAGGYSNPIVFVHGETPRMIPFLPNGATHSMLIPNSANGSEQSVYYTNLNLVSSVSLEPVNGTGQFTDFANEPGALDAALLMVYHTSLAQGASDYEQHRDGKCGGVVPTIWWWN
jgi:hypothetical protein